MTVNSEDIQLVSNDTAPGKLAGVIAAFIRDDKVCTLQAVGAGAVNQMVKAIIIASGYVAPSGYVLNSVPCFVDIEIKGEKRTAIRYRIERK
jgi:stage V sporulation protein S